MDPIHHLLSTTSRVGPVPLGILPPCPPHRLPGGEHGWEARGGAALEVARGKEKEVEDISASLLGACPGPEQEEWKDAWLTGHGACLGQGHRSSILERIGLGVLCLPLLMWRGYRREGLSLPLQVGCVEQVIPRVPHGQRSVCWTPPGMSHYV